MDATAARPRLAITSPGYADSMVLAEPCPAAHAERLLLTLASIPRRPVALALLTAAQRRARWQRAKLLYRVMRGMTGILIRLTLYGLAYRLVCAIRGGPFRRRHMVVRGPIRRELGARSPTGPGTSPPASRESGRVIRPRSIPF